MEKGLGSKRQIGGREGRSVLLGSMRNPHKPKKSSCTLGPTFAPCAPLGGEVAEWFKAHAWKACVVKTYRGFESPPLRQCFL